MLSSARENTGPMTDALVSREVKIICNENEGIRNPEAMIGSEEEIKKKNDKHKGHAVILLAAHRNTMYSVSRIQCAIGSLADTKVFCTHHNHADRLRCLFM